MNLKRISCLLIIRLRESIHLAWCHHPEVFINVQHRFMNRTWNVCRNFSKLILLESRQIHRGPLWCSTFSNRLSVDLLVVEPSTLGANIYQENLYHQTEIFWFGYQHDDSTKRFAFLMLFMVLDNLKSPQFPDEFNGSRTGELDAAEGLDRKWLILINTWQRRH